MDPFEEGRKKARCEIRAKELEQQQKQHINDSNSQRLYRALSHKIRSLGYQIWVDNGLHISMYKTEYDHNADLSISPDYNHPERSSIYVRSNASWHPPRERLQELSDRDVMVIVGEYYEATKERKKHSDIRIKRLEKEKAARQRELVSARRFEFFEENWGWGVALLIVIIVVFKI